MSDGISDMMIQEEAFSTFCELHPIEAFDLDNEGFYFYFRKKTKTSFTDDQIKEWVNSQR